MTSLVNLIAIGVIAFAAYSINQEDKRLGGKPNAAESDTRETSANRSTWTRSPVSGQWVEHDRSVSFMQSVGGGGGGCSAGSRQSADTLRRDQSHRQATPKLQGTSLDRTRPRF